MKNCEPILNALVEAIDKTRATIAKAAHNGASSRILLKLATAMQTLEETAEEVSTLVSIEKKRANSNKEESLL